MQSSSGLQIFFIWEPCLSAQTQHNQNWSQIFVTPNLPAPLPLLSLLGNRIAIYLGSLSMKLQSHPGWLILNTSISPHIHFLAKPTLSSSNHIATAMFQDLTVLGRDKCNILQIFHPASNIYISNKVIFLKHKSLKHHHILWLNMCR